MRSAQSVRRRLVPRPPRRLCRGSGAPGGARAFFQVRITHEETHAGAGGKRSMLLVVCSDTGKKRGCAKAHPRIGHPVWTEVTKSTPLCDNYAYVRENGRFYYTGRVVDADLANGVAGVQYYDMHMKLATRRSAAPSRTNQVSVRNITLEPLAEWLPVEEVMANIGTRHGDARKPRSAPRLRRGQRRDGVHVGNLSLEPLQLVLGPRSNDRRRVVAPFCCVLDGRLDRRQAAPAGPAARLNRTDSARTGGLAFLRLGAVRSRPRVVFLRTRSSHFLP